ncbi:MAG: hypothetical protein KVP17_003745 [Porospora cf. gigantea B]|uniref:uncharacterized protein n=1 Tax=Porospora cf. gigantea B TaxID=2853592 RepID=UPI003571C485|nr:MAG: hypothetical protein KVP17_003745 [Porospora cf. gigantea B]
MAPKQLTLEELQAKVEAGKKLSNKEKRLLERLVELEEQAKEDEVAAKRVDEDKLAAFSISLRGIQEGDKVKATGDDVVVKGFSISAPKCELFRDADLVLSKGRKYGFLGPNGRGKTTLLRFIESRKLPVPDFDILLVEQEKEASDVSVVDQVLSSHTKRQQAIDREQSLILEMEKAEADGVNDAGTWERLHHEMLEAINDLEFLEVDKAEPHVRRILSGLGFTENMMTHGTTTLSGGWRMRVALASALFIEPHLLLLDEPTNHLDLPAVLWLEYYMKHSFKKTAVTVSHDQDFIEAACTNILHLNNMKLDTYNTTNVAHFSRQVDQNWNKLLSDYETQQKELKKHKASQKTKKQAEEAVIKKWGTLMDRPRPYRVKFDFLSPEDTSFYIRLTNVDFSYVPGTPIFKDINFGLDCGDRVAIVGHNGSGKSTLMNLITKKLKPTEGESQWKHGLRIAVYDQHFEEHLPFDKSPVDFLKETYNLNEANARQQLGMFGLEGDRHKLPISALSGGQKARCVLASISQRKPHMLLLDEPTNHLDMESVEALIEGLKHFKGGVILISHDARLIHETDCRLFIVPGDTSVVEYGEGFDEYCSQVYDEIEKRDKEAEAEAERLAEQRKKLREEKLQKFAGLQKAKEEAAK